MKKTLLMLAIFISSFSCPSFAQPKTGTLTIANLVDNLEVDIVTDLLCGKNFGNNIEDLSLRYTSPLEENPIKTTYEAPVVASWENCALAKKSFFKTIDHSKIYITLKDSLTNISSEPIVLQVDDKVLREVEFAGHRIYLILTHEGEYQDHTEKGLNARTLKWTKTDLIIK